MAIIRPSPDPVLADVSIVGAEGLRLRPATAEDRPFLRTLYGQGRSDERAFVGWPDAEWEGFLDTQFLLQQLHYARHHPYADRWLIERPAGASTGPIGRLDLDRGVATWRLLELAIGSADRGRGAGGACMRWLQDSAVRGGAPAIDLHVVHGNDRAVRFYRRHGFAEGDSRSATHRRMVWRVS